MLAERIEDRALRRLIKKWLKAGVLDMDGTVRHPVTGTPPGGIGSPILAKVYVHDASICGAKGWSSTNGEGKPVGSGTQTLSWVPLSDSQRPNASTRC